MSAGATPRAGATRATGSAALAFLQEAAGGLAIQPTKVSHKSTSARTPKPICARVRALASSVAGIMSLPSPA